MYKAFREHVHGEPVEIRPLARGRCAGRLLPHLPTRAAISASRRGCSTPGTSPTPPPALARPQLHELPVGRHRAGHDPRLGVQARALGDRRDALVGAAQQARHMRRFALAGFFALWNES